MVLLLDTRWDWLKHKLHAFLKPVERHSVQSLYSLKLTNNHTSKPASQPEMKARLGAAAAAAAANAQLQDLYHLSRRKI